MPRSPQVFSRFYNLSEQALPFPHFILASSSPSSIFFTHNRCAAAAASRSSPDPTMVKKKNPTAAASSVSGGASAKASSNPPKKSTPDAPPPAPAPPAPSSSTAGSNPGDWLASSVTKRDEKRARSLGLISSNEGNVILPGAISRPNPPDGFTVMFLSFLYRGLSLPTHKFLHHLLRIYEIQLWQLTPYSILHLDVFITLCEAF